jgi:exopolysaccharide production protein ExoQ
VGGYLSISEKVTNKSPGIWDRSLALLIFVWSSHSLYGFLSESSVLDVSKIESPEIRNIWLIVYLFCAARLLFLRERISGVLPSLWPAIVLSGLAFLSYFWSIEPDLTLRRAFASLGTTIVILYLVLTFELDEFIKILLWAMFLVLVIATAVVIVEPSLGVHHDILYPAFRGSFPHKNLLGRAMFLGGLCALAIMVRRGPTIGHLGLFFAFLIMLMLSKSATAMILCAVAVCISIVFSIYRRSKGLMAAAIVGILLILIVSAGTGAMDLVNDGLLNLLGKDMTFSGRSLIWSVLWEQLTGDRFFVGFGHEAFWQSPRGSITIFSSHGYFIPPHAHNGILQLCVAFGVVGAFIGVVFIAVFAGRAYVMSHAPSVLTAYFCSAFFVTFFIMNFFEAQIFTSNYIIWMVAMTVFAQRAQQSHSSMKSQLSQQPRDRQRMQPI